MATLVFALRGNSTNARYSVGSPTGTKLNETYVTVVSDAGYLSGNYIDISDTARVKSLVFNGKGNTSNSRSMSILLRFAPTYTGAPAARRMIWSISTGLGTSTAYLELFHEVTSGNLVLIGKNEGGFATASTINLGAWTAGVSGTIYDFLFVWDGTTAANGMKLYIDNALLGAGGTATNALFSSWNNTYFKSIALGCGINGTVGAMRVDEFVIWDGAQSSSVCALVGGNGALDGAARTALVDCTAFDGTSYTDPGVANVKTGTAYTQVGVSLVGTYDGSDRWTAPSVGDLRAGIQLKNNSTSINLTGTLVAPSLANTKTGVAGDGGTGTYDGSDRWTDPGEANVRLATAYKANSLTNNKTGTLDYASTADVTAAKEEILTVVKLIRNLVV